MEVIFLHDVKNVGQRGQVKNVAGGFARNFLFPRKLAAQTTQALKNQFRHEEKVKEKSVKQKQTELNGFVSKLKKLELHFKEKASKEGTLFSGINKKMIAQKVKDSIDFKLSENDIEIEKPIKQIGKYSISIRISNKVYPLIIVINS